MESATASSTASNNSEGGLGGLIAILIAIVIGVVIGVVFGKSMWLASGGPQLKIETLQKTAAQKESTAAELDQQAEEAASKGEAESAERMRTRAGQLRDHIPKIEEKIAEVTLLDEEAKKNKEAGSDTVAFFLWELSKFAGDLFLQVLKLLVIPLVMTSMICGITSLGDVRKVGRVGGLTVFYYFATGAIAVLVGIMLVQVIQPGTGADDTFAFVTETVEAKKDTGVLDTLLNVFRGRPGEPGSGMFPSNIFQAASNTNVLALIVFAIVFGGALTTLGKKGKVAIDFFHAANEAVMKMVHLVMFFAPLGIYGLVVSNIAKNGGVEALGEELSRIGMYVMTVLIGLGIHVFVLAALLAIFARRNPLVYTFNILRALLTAMTTASSSATLPVTMDCVEGNNKVSNRSASFVLPLGATINMDGTALYEAVAVIFIAQSLGIPLETGQLVVIFLTATLAAVGAAGIPQAGLVTMVIVLTAVGLPMSGIGTILAVDWFLDRMRTTVNVYGDAIGAAVIDHQVTRQSG